MRCSQLFRLSGHVNLTGKIGNEHNYWSECIGLADSEAGSDIRCVGRSFRGMKYCGKSKPDARHGAQFAWHRESTGENSASVRREACAGLGALGIALDARKNEEASSGITEIRQEDSAVNILVIPTDEELEIARQTIETRRRNGGERGRGAGY